MTNVIGAPAVSGCRDAGTIRGYAKTRMATPSTRSRTPQNSAHKSIAITLDLYSHWMPDMGDFTADAMDDIL